MMLILPDFSYRGFKVILCYIYIDMFHMNLTKSILLIVPIKITLYYIIIDVL